MLHRLLSLFLLRNSLLHHPTAAQDLTRVCGSDYGDASYNCTVNPPCVTGDGCPADKNICFALPDSECFGPPSASPTELPLKVCAFDYDSATANCTGSPCDEFGACPAMMACFNVFPSECVNTTMGDATLLQGSADGNGTAPSGNAADLYVCAPSFEDAASNCTGGETCTPGGTECGVGEACFAVSMDMCSNSTDGETNATETNSTETNSTAETMMSGAPSSAANGTMEMPAAFPTAPPVQPDFLFVCGANYTDADQNICTNTGCPSGDGCDDGLTCFAVPFVLCSEEGNATTVATTTVATTVAATTVAAATTVSSMNDTITTVSAGNDTTTVVATTANSSIAEVNATVPVMMEGFPTAAPVPNLFFCGESYELAVTNCFTNTPCPSAAAEECPSGQACFGIPSQCLPPLPTSSPSEVTTVLVSEETTAALAGNETNLTEPSLTSAEPSLAPISMSPTSSPIVNERFCGANYTDALVSCDFDTACPGGFECPSGKTCFTGIICPATTAPPVPPPTAQTTSTPTLRGTASSSTASSMLGTSSGSTASSMTGTSATSSTAGPTMYRYCGFNPEDAADNCAINTPCPDGTADACFNGQTCFELSSPCNVPSPVASPVTSSAPSVSVTTKPVFDPSITSYCGMDYPDAQDNCYKNTPCPGNSNDECPNGQTCFPGIEGCEMPEVMTVAPTSAPEEGLNGTNVAVLPGAIVPTNAPSKKPAYEYEFPGFGENSVNRNDSFKAGGIGNFGVLVVSGVVGFMATMLL